ncbi:MAG: glycosyltransferase family 4 protein [Chlorobium sp.]|nr:glycosyltransferase family 4 protein [Chlorobium sp.]
MANNKPKICFVALNSYNLVAGGGTSGHIGGAEVQQWLTANWLRDKGFVVSFITLDHGQSDGSQHHGFTVYKAYNNNSGLPGLRFIWPRWSKLWSAMQRANCDIYYQRGAGLETGQVALWCHLNGKKFIHAVAHEPDCTPEMPMVPKLRERILYRYGLRRADAVIAQTESQQDLLQRHFRKDSCLVKNSALSTEDNHKAPINKFTSKSVLWVGRLVPVKRFEWLLDLAVKMPDVSFIVIGSANKSSEYDVKLQDIARKLSNIRLVGEVPYSQMHEYYRTAAMICCTSLKEGFPNVFLEAWREGLPVVSTVDPDGVITKNKLGYTANSVEKLNHHLSEILSDEKKYIEFSQNCLSYFQKNHTPDSTLPALKNLLIQLSSNNEAKKEQLPLNS